MAAKVRIPLQITWHQDIVPYPMPICVVTSRNAAGATNIAACASVFPWNVSDDHPQMVLVTRSSSRTSTNIRETKELCLNFMPARAAKAVVPTGRPADDAGRKPGLEGLALEPAARVAPERLADAIWVAECRLADVVTPGPEQNNLIVNVLEIWAAAALVALPKRRRLRASGVGIYFGMEDGRFYFSGARRPRGYRALPRAKVPALTWEHAAEHAMARVPALFRSTAKRAVEQALHAEGKTRVTLADVERLRPKRRPPAG